jgi:hypothetical protein
VYLGRRCDLGLKCDESKALLRRRVMDVSKSRNNRDGQ